MFKHLGVLHLGEYQLVMIVEYLMVRCTHVAIACFSSCQWIVVLCSCVILIFHLFVCIHFVCVVCFFDVLSLLFYCFILLFAFLLFLWLFVFLL